MKQHFVQKAYLKGFESNGLIWVARKVNGHIFRKPASWCTAHSDFQSSDLELRQNRIIEHPGISALRKLKDRMEINEQDIVSVCLWIGLHRLRSTNLIDIAFESREEYENRFWEELKTELQYMNQFFPFAFTYRPSGDIKFITSDNPIVEAHFDGGRVVMFSLSPDCLLVFSSNNSIFEHKELSIDTMVNAMMWNSANNYVFSSKNCFQVNEYLRICEKWNLRRQIIREQFLVEPIAKDNTIR